MQAFLNQKRRFINLPIRHFARNLYRMTAAEEFDARLERSTDSYLSMFFPNVNIPDLHRIYILIFLI